VLHGPIAAGFEAFPLARARPPRAPVSQDHAPRGGELLPTIVEGGMVVDGGRSAGEILPGGRCEEDFEPK
jgi:hypothetical protein